jgi:hypothetical protein
VATHYTILGIAFALALIPAYISLCSVFAQPLVHGVKTNSSTLASLRNATISIHTKNIIQANSFNILNKERALVKKSLFSNIDNVVLMAKGGVKNTIPVNVNAKIINQLDNNRIDTTQGVNMTKSLTATEHTHKSCCGQSSILQWHKHFRCSMYFHDRYSNKSNVLITCLLAITNLRCLVAYISCD